MSDPQTPGGADKKQQPVPVRRKLTFEENIQKDLRAGAKKAYDELVGIVTTKCLDEALESMTRRDAKDVIAQASNYARAIAIKKKYRGHHLLLELGIKLPPADDKKPNGKKNKTEEDAP